MSDQRFFLTLAAGGVVFAKAIGVDDQPDAVEVTAEVFDAAVPNGSAYVDGALQPYSPAAIAPYGDARQQLGGTFLGAVQNLGWWGWMDQGAAYQAAPKPNGADKPLDARYWSSLGKADQVLAADAKLNRVAKAAEAARVAASGQPAPAQPVITVAAAMDHGDAMVAAGS